RNLVQIDEYPEEIGRNFPVRLGVVGHLPATLRALAAALEGREGRRGSAARVRELRRRHNVYQPRPPDRAPTSTPWALSALREVLPRDTLVAGDSGLTLQYVKHFFPVYAP